MNQRLLIATLATLLCSWPAAAEPARFALTLPNCPTPLVLNAPAAFEGAQNEQHILDHMASNTARKGTYVLSLTAPAAPQMHLLALELGTTKDSQGHITQTWFDELRESMLHQDVATLIKNSDYARALAAGAKPKYEIKGTNIYRVSGNEHEVILLGLTHGMSNGVETVNYLASKFVYAQNCVAQVSMFAPVSSMAIEEFEALVPEISVQ